VTPVVVAYISGHGFGHFTRTEAVLSRVAERGAAVHVRTCGLVLALARRAAWARSVEEVDLGPGLVQKSAFEPDLEASRAALDLHLARHESIVAGEVRALRALGAQVVYADVPPLAFEAAHRASVPSVALANFSWSAIYESAGLHAIARACAERDRLATLLLALPLAVGLVAFPRREAIPLIARPIRRTRDEARALLGVPASDPRPRVLLSFGGFSTLAMRDAIARAALNPRFRFVAFLDDPRDLELPENVTLLSHHHGLPHQELVLGSDVLLGKLGFGTVAEALAARTPIVHVERGLPGEYPVLAAAVARYLRSAPIPVEDLLAGRWTPSLERALASTPRDEPPPLGGESVAADRLLSFVR
jgi:L-arabinokinase